MSSLSEQAKAFLLKSARYEISSQLGVETDLQVPEKLPEVSQKRGAFVTLHKKGQLCGCIGTIEPSKPLDICVQENALHAAFHDYRFTPVEADELADIEIEISVLTVPKILEYKDEQELLRFLKPNIHGVILSQRGRSATFLPQVWSQLPNQQEFLEHLCRKASLPPQSWKSDDTLIKTYEVLYFSESIT